MQTADYDFGQTFVVTFTRNVRPAALHSSSRLPWIALSPHHGSAGVPFHSWFRRLRSSKKSHLPRMGSSPSATVAAVPGLSHNAHCRADFHRFTRLFHSFVRSGSTRRWWEGSDRFAETPPILGSLLVLNPISRRSCRVPTFHCPFFNMITDFNIYVRRSVKF